MAPITEALLIEETRKELISSATGAEEKQTLRAMPVDQLKEFLSKNTNLLDR